MPRDTDYTELIEEIKDRDSDKTKLIAALELRISVLEKTITRLEGVGIFLKLCILFGAPVGAWFLWARDHIKL